jgi:RNA polymerase sigma-70 factor (ECF subfamily)
MSDARDRTDEELARDAQRGDAAAFDALVRRYLRPAMALAWQYTRGVEDAEDVVQEAFHRAVRALANYDRTRPFSAWFYAIVRNVARTAISREGRRAALAPLTVLEGEPPAPVAPDPALHSDAERAIEALAPMQQACVRLCDLEGFTSAEAGRMLGISDNSVRTHLRRAREHLRVALGPQRRMMG